MTLVCSPNPCPIIVPAQCVFYEGSNLINSGINTNDSLQEALEKLDLFVGNSAIIYESVSNKQNSLVVDGTGIKYPTVDAVNAGLLAFQYTDEKAQDAVGSIFADSATIQLIYLDGVPEIYAIVSENSITSVELADNIVTSTFINDGPDGIHPYLTTADAVGYIPYTGAIQNVDLGEFQLKTGQVVLDQTPTQTPGVATLIWNPTTGTVEIGVAGGEISLPIGQTTIKSINNQTGTSLLQSEYKAILITGSLGTLSDANSIIHSDSIIGLVTENINDGEYGFIVTQGVVLNINTTGSLQGETWSSGDVLYLDPAANGEITNIKPAHPNKVTRIGQVINVSGSLGSIYVNTQIGVDLSEVSDILITSVVNNNILSYETSSSLWKNKTIVEVLGYTPENVSLKQNSLTVDGSGTKYITVDAVIAGLALKQDIITNPVTGVGTTNYLAKWASTSSQTNSRIFDNGTIVGVYIGGDIVFTVSPAGNSLFGITTDNLVDTVQVVGSIKATSSIQVGDNAELPSASNVGALRYRSDANNSYVDMSMQTGAATYAWVNIVQNNW